MFKFSLVAWMFVWCVCSLMWVDDCFCCTFVWYMIVFSGRVVCLWVYLCAYAGLWAVGCDCFGVGCCSFAVLLLRCCLGCLFCVRWFGFVVWVCYSIRLLNCLRFECDFFLCVGL